MKKRSLFTGIALSLMIAAAVPAPYKAIYYNSVTAINRAFGISTLREETEWYYRVVNGRLQKRLWSYTYGKWRTPWKWV